METLFETVSKITNTVLSNAEVIAVVLALLANLLSVVFAGWATKFVKVGSNISAYFQIASTAPTDGDRNDPREPPNDPELEHALGRLQEAKE